MISLIKLHVQCLQTNVPANIFCIVLLSNHQTSARLLSLPLTRPPVHSSSSSWTSASHLFPLRLTHRGVLEALHEPLQDNDPMAAPLCSGTLNWSGSRNCSFTTSVILKQTWFPADSHSKQTSTLTVESTVLLYIYIYIFTTTQHFIFSLWFPTLPRVTRTAHRESERVGTSLFHSAVGSVCRRRERYKYFSSQEKNKRTTYSQKKSTYPP